MCLEVLGLVVGVLVFTGGLLVYYEECGGGVHSLLGLSVVKVLVFGLQVFGIGLVS